MSRFGLNLALCWSVVLSSSLPAWAEEESSWVEPHRLLSEGKTEQALLLLLSDIEEHAGQPEFDYLLAKAYRQSGQLSHAVFSLQRVLMIEPDNTTARLMSAGIYADSGDTAWAGRELSQLSTGTLSREMRIELARIRHLISKKINVPKSEKRQKKRAPFKVQANISAGFGYDSNATYGPGESALWIPSLADTTQLGDSAADDDLFLLAGGRVAFQYAVHPKTTLSGSAKLTHKAHQERNDLDEAYEDLQLKLSHRLGKEVVSLTAINQSYRVDGDAYRYYWGGRANWNHPLNGGAWINGYLQQLEFAYPDDDTYDAEQTLAGIYHWLPFTHSGRAGSIRYGVHTGAMDAKRSDSTYVGYDQWGGRVDASYQLQPALTISASLTFEQRRHQGVNPLYETIREDNQWTTTLSATYAVNDTWSLTPGVSYTDNDSNLALYDYDRALVTLTLKREFKP